MDSVTTRFSRLYGLWVVPLVIGTSQAASEGGSTGSVWDHGGAPLVLALALGLVLVWGAVAPGAEAWPPSVLVPVGGLALLLVAGEDDYALGAGSELVATTAGLALVTAVAHIAALVFADSREAEQSTV